MSTLGSVVTTADMYFHRPRYRDFRWFETNWFSWLIPEARMRCHVRSGFRTNLGVVETTVFVFDNPDPHAGPLGVLYEDTRYHVPMPPQNLDRYDLANGLSVRMTKPREAWELRYEGVQDTCFDLHYEALMPPVHISETGTKDAALATIRRDHIDQTMAVTGKVRVRGREYEVDWPSNRDHSWSPRPESSTSGYGHPVSSNFDTCHMGRDLSFLVQTTNPWEDLSRGMVTNGYLLDHGALLRLESGEGRYTYEPDGWRVTRLEYQLDDERGRSHHFVGTPLSFRPGGVGTLAVVRWERTGGQVGWGELNWHGDLYRMQALGRPTARPS
jgi:hypothetical protein